MDDDTIICVCNHVTVHHIREAILAGDMTFEAMQARTGLGTVCGACISEGETVFDRIKDELK